MLCSWPEQHHSQGISYPAASRENCLGRCTEEPDSTAGLGVLLEPGTAAKGNFSLPRTHDFQAVLPPHNKRFNLDWMHGFATSHVVPSLPQAPRIGLILILLSSTCHLPWHQDKTNFSSTTSSSSPVLEHFLCCEPRTPAVFDTSAGEEAHVHSRMREER